MSEYVRIYLAIAAILGALVIVYTRSRRRNKDLAVIDIGVWWLAFLVLYSILPILFWLVTGEFQSVATNRLEIRSTSASDIAELLTIAACYATAFVPAYLFVSRSTRFKGPLPIAKIDSNVLVPTALLFITTWLVMQVVSPGVGGDGGYESRFLILSELSLALRRIHKFVVAFFILSSFVLMVALLQRPRIRTFVVVAIPVFVFVVANAEGSRGPAFLVMLVFLISWHGLVRPIPHIVWGSLALLGILAFNLLGVIRSQGQFPDASQVFAWMIAAGEFEHIFGNAVDVLHAVHDKRLDVPAAARFAEFFAFLPSELLPFEKTTLADWFIDNFYPSMRDEGSGLSFGTLAQAVIGYGAVEAIVRGFVFGIVLGLVYKVLVTHGSRWWWIFPVYLYLLTRIFDSVRQTMFSFLADVVQTLIPFILLLWVASQVLRLISRFFHQRTRSASRLATAPSVQQS